MLILSRSEGEEIVIAEEIVVKVLEIQGKKARLGITASSDIPIHRKEIQDAIDRQRSNESLDPRGV